MMWCRGERRRMAMAHTLEESGSRQMSGTVFRDHIAKVFLPGRGHTRVNNLNFRIVTVLNQPVGGDKI